MVARGGAPLLDPRLVTRTPGYAAGVALISVYFVGFSGVFLVLALFFQSGLGYTPLQSGLAVTPFSIAAAVSAVVAGRLVARAGRLLTVLGLAGVAPGFGAAALLLLARPGRAGRLVDRPGARGRRPGRRVRHLARTPP